MKDDITIYKKVGKRVNTDVFLKFLADLLNNIKRDYFLRRLLLSGNICLVFDNASYHKTAKILKFCKEKSLNVLFTAPYWPDGNLAEYIFGLKQYDFGNEAAIKTK